METNYKILLQYDGTRYDGWQKQGNTDNTIQGRLESVLSRFAGCPVEVQGSGRTDGGAHANGQVANFKINGNTKPEEVMEYLNRYLPEDILIVKTETVDARFHSRLNAVSKIYSYRIETAAKKDVFERKFVYGLGKQLDLERMKKAAAYLLGEHDFQSFCSNKKMKKSAVRRIDSVEIIKKGTKVVIRYQADGFLYNMVRILTGTLIEVGLSDREPESIKDIIEAKDRQAAGFTAPPEGLCLESVRYEKE